MAGERLAAMLVGSGIGALDVSRAAYPQHGEALEVAKKVPVEARDGLEALSATEQIPSLRSLLHVRQKTTMPSDSSPPYYRQLRQSIV